jgi:hypothetical protein
MATTNVPPQHFAAALAEGAMELYNWTIPAIAGLTLNAGTPKLMLLAQYAPH